MAIVSVIMSVYNDDAFVARAVESILSQTLKEFEFIIVNDGSTDRCEQAVAGFRDSRIHVITNQRNLGLAYSLNRGIALANGKYIARQDADDVSLPHRLATQ